MADYLDFLDLDIPGPKGLGGLEQDYRVAHRDVEGNICPERERSRVRFDKPDTQ